MIPLNMCSILFVLLGVLFAKIEAQISLSPGESCGGHQNTVSSIVSLRVSGGSDISAEDAPWHARLKIKTGTKVLICGGSIISPNIILTAAHCVWQNERECPEHVRNQQSARECHKLRGGCPSRCVRARPEDLKIDVGVTGANQENRIPIKVKDIILHPGWKKSSFDLDAIQSGHDLALIVLESGLQFSSKVRPVCLPVRHLNLYSGRDVTVNGFGLIDPVRKLLAKRLQQGLLKITDKESCFAEYEDTQIPILGDQVCAYSPTTDSCGGDSGGGLVTSVGSATVLVGIVSYGTKKCRSIPGVYTNVQSHVDWIQQKLTDIKANRGSTPLWTYTEPVRACLFGHDDRIYSSLSLEECKSKCSSSTAFECNSLEYLVSPKWDKTWCYISHETRRTQPRDYQAPCFGDNGDYVQAIYLEKKSNKLFFRD